MMQPSLLAKSLSKTASIRVIGPGKLSANSFAAKLEIKAPVWGFFLTDQD